MSYLTIVILIFSILGAIDKMFGNRLGLGKEFEKAFMLIGTMALSMIGMIVISPVIAQIMKPVSETFTNVLHIDASIIPASLFANDMGGAPLAVEMASNDKIGFFNALVVSSMMGCTVSFTIPFALGLVDKRQHKELLLGLLCGIVTIPIGCFVSGIMCKIPVISLLWLLMPIIVFSGIIAFGIVRFPVLCIKVFKLFGTFITILITFGLALGIIKFLTGFEVVKGIATLEEGASICVNAAVVLSGSFPLMYILSKGMAKPLKVIAEKIGVNEQSVIGIISCIATSATTFGMMEKMDRKGIVLNSAFAVSGAFVLGGHLAFTMAFNSEYVLPVIVGKLTSGILALFLANIIFKKTQNYI